MAVFTVGLIGSTYSVGRYALVSSLACLLRFIRSPIGHSQGKKD